MMPDPAEFDALDATLKEFQEAYVDVVQAVRRLQRIYEIEKVRPDESPPEDKCVAGWHEHSEGYYFRQERCTRCGAKPGARTPPLPKGPLGTPPPKHKHAQVQCPRCASWNMIRRGGGCLHCMDCSFAPGCGQ